MENNTDKMMENNTENETVRLVDVDTDNFYDLVKLSPGEEGKEYVASNVFSLAEAYANVAEGRYAKPFGIYLGDTPVGFLMIGYGIVDEDDDTEEQYYLKDSYLFWRFMVDEKYQNKGYGRQAMQLALDFIRTFPSGPAKYCWLSYEPENKKAKKLYESFGFVEEKLPEGWDEIPSVLEL